MSNFNTRGKLVYPVPGGGTSSITPDGEIVGETVPPEKRSWWDRWGETIHTTLDVAGMVPVIGEVADGANALIYLGEGDLANAAISGAALWPAGGQVATGARLGAKAVGAGIDAVRTADKAKDAINAAEVATDAVKAADQAKDAAKGADAVQGTARSADNVNDAAKAPEGTDGTSVKGDGNGNGPKKKDKQRCDSLRRAIENGVTNLTQKRAPDIENNDPTDGLPAYNPYRTKPHRQDVLGHQLKFRLEQTFLKRNIAEYLGKNCGPLPRGAMQAANMPLPVPLQPPPPGPPAITPKLP